LPVDKRRIGSIRDFSPSDAAGPSKLRRTLLAGAQVREKVAEQPQAPMVKRRRAPQVVGWFFSAHTSRSSCYSSIVRRNGGRLCGDATSPRDIWTKVRQGACGLRRICILRGLFFSPPLGHLAIPPKIRGAKLRLCLLPLLLLVLLDPPRAATRVLDRWREQPPRVKRLLFHAQDVQAQGQRMARRFT